MIIYRSDGVPIIDIEVDDTSYRTQTILGADEVLLEFSLTEHVELPIGAYVMFENSKYELMTEGNVRIIHNRDYEYKVTFYGSVERTKYYIVHNLIDHRITFDLTATPQEHLQLIVDNLNERDGAGVWSVGTCIAKDELTITYNHTYCYDALTQLASEFNTEVEFDGFEISLRKVEYYKDSPLALGYGKYNGFVPGIERVGSSQPIEKVWIQGSDTNISLKEYGAARLHLPVSKTVSFDGEHFAGEQGYVAERAIVIETDADGYSVKKYGAAGNCTEGSLDLSSIYPKRVGITTAVRFAYKGWYYTLAELQAAYPSLTDDDWDEVQVDIVDADIPDGLDYDECLMVNDTPLSVTFQSGTLSGRSFNATFKKAARTQTRVVGGVTQTVTRPANRFELEKADHDGVNMPTRNYLPSGAASTGDKYIVTNCYLPQAYIQDDASKTGASWDALREAAKYLYENKDTKRTYTGELDGLFAKRDWVNIAPRLRLGAYISFSHPSVQATPIEVRIMTLKQYINDPYAPKIEISNELASVGKASQIAQLQSETAHADIIGRELQSYTKRSFRDAKETARMLVDAAIDGYDAAIQPITIQTMQMIAGDETLQFRFVTSLTDMTVVDCPVRYDTASKKVKASAGFIQHQTLGISDIKPNRDYSAYKRWSLSAYESAVLSEPETKYYVYAKVSKTTTTGEYLLSSTAIGFEEVTGYWHLLIGTLNSEYDGGRSFVTLYGFTEVLPGRITTDKIVSSNGNSFWDLLNEAFKLGSKLRYNENGNGELVLNGTFVQTGSGEIVEQTAYCGQYSGSRTYKRGDEVVYADESGIISTYRYVNSIPSSGHAPTDANYWIVSAKGVKGKDGDNGQPGTNGRGIFSTSVFYAKSNDGQTAPEDGWQLTIPALVSGEYLWTKTVIRYTDYPATADSVSYSVSKFGNDGSAGSRVYRTYVLYQVDSQGTTPPEGEWETVIPALSPGDYLWTKTVVRYADYPATLDSVSYTVSRQGSNGQNGQNGEYTAFRFLASDTQPSAPRSYSPNPEGWSDIPPSQSYDTTPTYGKEGDWTVESGVYTAPAIGNNEYTRCRLNIRTVKPNTTLVVRVQVNSEMNYDRLLIGNLDQEPTVGQSYLSDGNYIERVSGSYKDVNVKVDISAAGSHYLTFIFAKDVSQSVANEYAKFSIESATYRPKVWMTSARVNSSGVVEGGNWSYPIVVNGEDGARGADSPALCFRGDFDATETYFGTSSRCDVVYNPVTKKYYRAKPSVGTYFSGIIPTNTAYWMDFGASFDSVATGLLLAQEAVIEKAVIRKLKTADSGKRIVATDNQLAMYDADGEMRLLVSGDELSGSQSGTQTAYGTQTALNDTVAYRSDYSTEGRSQGITVETGSGATLSLPALELTAVFQMDTMLLNYTEAIFEIGYEIDGVIRDSMTRTLRLETTSSAPVEASATLPSVSIPIAPGNHTIKTICRLTVHGEGSDGTMSYEAYSSTLSDNYVRVSYSDRKTEIASNGFRVMFGTGTYAEFSTDGTDAKFVIIAGNYGLRVTNGGVQKTSNGGATWTNI